MSLRSPLGAVLGRGTARGGVHDWWVQRATAVALVPLSAWFVWSLTGLPLADHAAVTAWVAAGWNPVWLALTLVTMLWHSRLGVRVVIEDYLHGAAKTATLILADFAHAVVLTAGLYALARIALRSP